MSQAQFLGGPAPEAPAKIDFIKPLSAEAERTSPEFFNILNFVLGFYPPNQDGASQKACSLACRKMNLPSSGTANEYFPWRFL